jgi:hypothetical protein
MLVIAQICVAALGKTVIRLFAKDVLGSLKVNGTKRFHLTSQVGPVRRARNSLGFFLERSDSVVIFKNNKQRGYE